MNKQATILSMMWPGLVQGTEAQVPHKESRGGGDHTGICLGGSTYRLGVETTTGLLAGLIMAVLVFGEVLRWWPVPPVRRQEGEGRRWQEARRRGEIRHRGEGGMVMVYWYSSSSPFSYVF